MKPQRAIVLALLVSSFSSAYAADRTHMAGINYTVGPSFIIGGDGATDASSVEPGIGAGLQYGFTRQLDFRFDYDYFDADLRTQALTFGGQWKFAPESNWGPFAGGGIGFGKPYSGEGWDHFALKLTGGLEKELTSNVTIAPVISYLFVDGKDPFGSVHAIEPGIRLTYYFATIKR